MQLQPLVYYFRLKYPMKHIQRSKHVRTYIYTEDRCISKIVWTANRNASRACQKPQVVLRDAADQEPITPLGFTFQSYAGPIQSHCAGFKKPEIENSQVINYARLQASNMITIVDSVLLKTSQQVPNID